MNVNNKLANGCGWLAFLLAALIPAAPAWAQVDWAAREVRLASVAGTTEPLSAAFAFKNTGEKPVTVTSVKPSCGCTTAKLDKTTYAPGESGVIRVAFDMGDRVGPQIKKVVVRTDDATTPVTTLTLRVDIRKLLELSPQLLLWAAGEARGPKELMVSVAPGRAITVADAVVKGAAVSVVIEEVQPDLNAENADRVPSPESDAPAAGATTDATSKADANQKVNPTVQESGDDAAPSPPRVFRVRVTPPNDGSSHRALIRLRSIDEGGEPLPDEKFLVRVMAAPPTPDNANAG